jgi:hypothetical protein
MRRLRSFARRDSSRNLDSLIVQEQKEAGVESDSVEHDRRFMQVWPPIASRGTSGAHVTWLISTVIDTHYSNYL